MAITRANGSSMVQITPAAKTLLDDASVSDMRATLGVPALAEINTFNAEYVYLAWEDNGAAGGPNFVSYRDSASPAASDQLGRFSMRGNNSAGEVVIYAFVGGEIVDPTDGSEDGGLLVQTIVAGTLATRMSVRNGAYMVGATGGDQGAGTLNAVGLYQQGVKVGQWLSGAGAPADGTGANGDYYLDSTASAWYGPKAAGTWVGTGPVSLAGPTGATGAAGADLTEPEIVTLSVVTAEIAVGDVTGKKTYKVTMDADAEIQNPTNGTDGQRIVIAFTQDGTGSRLLTFDTKWKFGTDITGATLSTAAGATDYLTAIYNATADKWHVVAFVKGY